MQVRSRALFLSILDAGMLSLATFAVGIYAAREFDTESLAAYALVFSAYIFLNEFVTHFLLTPLEVIIHRQDPHLRGRHLRWTYRRALPRIGAIALLPLSASLLAPTDGVSAQLTTAACALLTTSALNHQRRVLHATDRPAFATMASSGAAVLTLALMGLGHFQRVDSNLVPFGAVAIANGVASTGLAAAIRVRWRTLEPLDVSARRLRRSGSYLFTAGTLPQLGNLVSTSIVGWLAGANALAVSEASRILARPVGVVVTGLAATIFPRAVKASAHGAWADLRSLKRTATAVSAGLVGTAVFTLPLPFDWNPLTSLVPRAFESPTTTILFLVSGGVAGVLVPFVGAILGREDERGLAVARGSGAALTAVAALSSIALGAAARPISELAGQAGSLTILRGKERLDEAGGSAKPDPQERPK